MKNHLFRYYFYLLLGTLSFSGGCSSNNFSNQRNSHSAQISNSEELAQLEQAITSEVIQKDENGKSISMKGFISSDKFKEGSDEAVRNAFESKNSTLFTYDPPEGMDADFSEPIMTNASYLFLTEGDSPEATCSALTYQDEAPTIGQLITASKTSNICGATKVNFCFRFSFLNSEADTKNYIYAMSPELELYLPCPQKVFTGISVTINEASMLNKPESADIDIVAGALVSKMYLSNKNDCSEGAWETLVSKKKAWPLQWNASKSTTKVYAKFQEIIFDETSDCFEASFSDTTPPSTPERLHNIASTLKAASFTWAASRDTVSGVASYELALGSSAGATDVVAYTDVGLVLGHTLSGLSLNFNDTYFASVRAVDAAGSKSAPKASEGFKANATSLSAQSSHVCAILSSNNQLKCWGLNTSAQLGIGAIDNRGDGANEMGANLPAVNLGTGRSAVAVSVGELHSCALLDDASVKCWGLSDRIGRLGTESNEGIIGKNSSEMGDPLAAVDLGGGRSAINIALGNDHACAVLDNGSVKCWGFNVWGQLGLEDTGSRGHTTGTMGEALPPVNLGTGRTALQVTAGKYFSCALLDNARVKCWGQNSFGELGLGDIVARGKEAGQMGDNLQAIDLGPGVLALRVAASREHTCAVLSSGDVKCWGENDVGQLGLGHQVHKGDGPAEMGSSLPAVSLGSGLTATGLGLGFKFSCATLSNSSLKCWGGNGSGQLGYGDTSNRGNAGATMGDSLLAIDLGNGKTARQVVGGNTFACAALNDGSIKCWGSNTYGQLGQGDTSIRGDDPSRLPKDLSPVNL